MGHLLDAIESGDPERVEAAMERVSIGVFLAERNVLEKLKHIWQHYEFAQSLLLSATIPDEKSFIGEHYTSALYAGHITAGELRAAFGRDNPLIAEFEIAEFEKEKGATE